MYFIVNFLKTPTLPINPPYPQPLSPHSLLGIDSVPPGYGEQMKTVKMKGNPV